MIGQLPHRRVKLLGADIMEIRWVGILPQSLRETCATKDWQPDQTEKHKPQLNRYKRLQIGRSLLQRASNGHGEFSSHLFLGEAKSEPAAQSRYGTLMKDCPLN